MITTNIIFDRKGKATNKKLGTVEILVTVNRRNQYVSSGIRLLKNEWRYGQIINRPDSDELMNRLMALKKKIEEGVTRCIEHGEPIDLKAIRDGVVEMPSTVKMLDWMYAEIDSLNLAPGTMKHYKKLMERLEEFAQIQTWTDANVENVLAFDSWLHRLEKPLTKTQEMIVAHGGKVTREKMSDAGVHNYHKCLKALFERALMVGKLQQNPYARLKGKFKRGDKENVEYLTEDEMHAIENLQDLSRIYDEARDLFVVQMYTGLPYSDLMAFSFDDYKLVGGKYVRRSERIKTGIPFVSQLLPPVIKVLEKYGYHLPYINNAEYNERLKVIGRLAEIATPLHTHLGRHTFATWMLSNGVPIEHVSKMLGHTNITQTQRYAKVLAKDVRGSFDAIEKKMKENGVVETTAKKG